MFGMKLAGHDFIIHNQYAFVENLCRDYITPEVLDAVHIDVNQEEIEREQDSEIHFSMGYLESLAIYRKICEHLIDRNILLFHSSAIMVNGKAILFTGKSGAGKSTQTMLWKKKYQDAMTIINGDKPLLKFEKDQITVYGTPYAGKEGLQTNTSAPVAAIIFIEQAPYNRLTPVLRGEAFTGLYTQTYKNTSPGMIAKVLPMTERLSQLPVYRLECTISSEAVDLVYNTLRKAGIL